MLPIYHGHIMVNLQAMGKLKLLKIIIFFTKKISAEYAHKFAVQLAITPRIKTFLARNYLKGESVLFWPSRPITFMV